MTIRAVTRAWRLSVAMKVTHRNRPIAAHTIVCSAQHRSQRPQGGVLIQHGRLVVDAFVQPPRRERHMITGRAARRDGWRRADSRAGMSRRIFGHGRYIHAVRYNVAVLMRTTAGNVRHDAVRRFKHRLTIRVIPQYSFSLRARIHDGRARRPISIVSRSSSVVPIAANVIARGLQADQHHGILLSRPFFTASRQSGEPSPGLVVVARKATQRLPPYVTASPLSYLVAAEYAAVEQRRRAQRLFYHPPSSVRRMPSRCGEIVRRHHFLSERATPRRITRQPAAERFRR